MPPARPLAATLATAALMALSACGGDDDGASTSDKAASESAAAKFRREGNALCKQGRSRIERIPQPSSPDQLADYVERLFDEGEELNDGYARLDPPPDLRQPFAESVRLARSTEGMTDEIVDRIRAAENPVAATQREFKRFLKSRDVKRSIELSRRLGLEECLEVGPPSEQPSPS